MDIIGGISAVSAAIKLAKELRGIDGKVDQADLKLRLIELTDKLLEAKEALQDAKQERAELLSELETLKSSINQQGNLEDENGCLYELDEGGKRIGDPFCNRCFVSGDKMFRLIKSEFYSTPKWQCVNCKSQYAR